MITYWLLMFLIIYNRRTTQNSWKKNAGIINDFLDEHSQQKDRTIPIGADIAPPGAWSLKSPNITLVYSESSNVSANPVLKIVKQLYATYFFTGNRKDWRKTVEN